MKSDKLNVQSAEAALQATKLYAPQSGTIVTLSGQVGEVVTANGTTRAATEQLLGQLGVEHGGHGHRDGGALGHRRGVELVEHRRLRRVLELRVRRAQRSELDASWWCP